MKEEGDNKRKRPVYRAALPVPRETSEKVCFYAVNYGCEVTRMHLYRHAYVCVSAHGELFNEHKIGGDRSWKRSSGKLSGARRRDFFYPGGSTNRLRSRNCSPRRRGEGQGLECLTAGS